MTTETPSPPTLQPIDGVKLFNEFQSQSRARAEATLKLVMGISGAMLTLTVGAVLGGTPAKIPSHLLSSLQLGWVLLFFCIAASVLLMCSMIVATFHMGVKMQKTMEGKSPGFVFVATWSWLRVANGVLALLILCSFLAGIGLVGYVAVGVAEKVTKASSVQRSAPESSPAPAHRSSAPNPSLERTPIGAAQGKR
jgi:hypothetical protein